MKSMFEGRPKPSGPVLVRASFADRVKRAGGKLPEGAVIVDTMIERSAPAPSAPSTSAASKPAPPKGMSREEQIRLLTTARDERKTSADPKRKR